VRKEDMNNRLRHVCRSGRAIAFLTVICYLATLPAASTSRSAEESLAATRENRPTPAGELVLASPRYRTWPPRRFMKAGANQPMFAPSIMANKSASLDTDIDGDTRFDPGDTIKYQVVISASGMDATNVSFSDTIDSNTTFVAGSLMASPIAVDDTYQTIGNVKIQVPVAQGVIQSNDLNPNGSGTLTVTKANATNVPGGGSATASTTHGSVTMSSDGSFTYNPNAGDHASSDTFTYTLDNGTGMTDTATVTINITGLIWFIDNTPGPAGDGRLASPFRDLAGGANNFNATAADAAGDAIFIYTGAGNYTGGVTLLNNQKLIGQGAGASILSITGLPTPSGNNLLPSTGGTNPTITAGANDITLGSGNTVRGVNLNVTATAATALTGSSFGTLTLAEVAVGGTNGRALNLDTGTLTGPVASTAAFTSISSSNSTTSPSATGILLKSVGGSMSSGSTTVSNPAGIGISVDTSSATFSFGTTSSTSTGGTAISLTTNTGTITFGAITIAPDANQRGLLATNNSNTITIPSGTITASGNIALEITRTSPNTTPLVISLTSVTASNGTKGISLQNTTGSFTITGTGTTDGSGGTISDSGSTMTRGIEMINVQNISLSNTTLTNACRVNGAVSVGNSASDANQNTDENGAIHLQSATNVSLTNVDINGSAQHGINGNLVTNLDLTNCTITGCGNTVWESSIYMFNLRGLASANQKNVFDNVDITNTSGQFNIILFEQDGTNDPGGERDRLEIINGCSFNRSGMNDLISDNITVLSYGTNAGQRGNIQVVVSNATFSSAVTCGSPSFAGTCVSDNIQVDASESASYDFSISNCTFNNAGQSAINISTNNSGAGTYAVMNNSSISVRAAVGINVIALGASHVSGTISGNTISTSVSNNPAFGISLGAENAGSSVIADVNSNSITGSSPNQFSQGIRGYARSSGTLDLILHSNSVQTAKFEGIEIASGNNTAGEAPQVCVDFLNNNIDGSNGALDYILDMYSNSVFKIKGLTGSGTNQTNVESFVAATDTDPSPSDPTVLALGGTVVNYASSTGCATPSGMSLGPDLQARSAMKTDDASIETGQALIVANGEARSDDNVAKLTMPELLAMAQAALERWQQAGVSAEDLMRMQQATFEIGDLPGEQIAVATPTGIKVDEAAAGYGWFFDLTPQEDSEFTVPVPGRELQTTEYSQAYGKMDLLTVLMREMGRVYLQGKQKMPKSLRPLMGSTLMPGVRRLPDARTITLNISRLQKNTTPERSTAPGLFASDRMSAAPQGIVEQHLLQVAYNTGATKVGALHYAVLRRPATATARPMFVGPITKALGTIPTGKSVTVMFKATINATNSLPANTTQVCNTAGPITADGGVSVNSNQVCSQLDVADLSVTKIANAATVCSTSNITYTITYNNAGPSAASNPVVSDPMPTGTHLVSVTTPANWSRTDAVPNNGNGTITFTRASSANGENATFTVVVSIDGAVTDGAALTNTASVTSNTADTTPANNASSQVSVTVKTLPTPASVGTNQNICALAATTGLGGNSPTSGTGMWAVQSGGAGTFSPNASTPNATFTHTSGTGPIVLRWTISNAPCTDSFAEVTITVKVQPTATVGANQTICALGTTAGLGGNTPSGGATGTWSIISAGTGTFSPNASAPNATFTHTSGTGPITLRWTVSNAPCADATADVVITITQPPTSATVGANQTICALSTTTGLGGNTPTSGTGTWTVQSGGAGTFSPNATTGNATFTHTSGTGPITLRWTISNSPCTDSFAEVTVTIKTAPTASAGGPQTICALGTTTGLGGNTPSGGASGTWSIVTAGVTGTFTPNATTPNATFTHTSGGIGTTTTLRWTVSNAPCADATADVSITIKAQPTASAGGPQTICAGGTTAALGGNTPPTGASGTWSIVTAGVTGAFTPDATTPNATFTHTGGGIGTTITIRWTVSNAPCTSATVDVSITIQPAPTASTGDAQTICAGSTTAGLGGNTPAMNESGMWSIVTGGVTGAFSPDATTPNATFTPTSGAGTITLRWTVTNATCGTSATADAVITVKAQPTATTGGNQTICALGTSAGLGGNTPAGGATGMWSVGGGGSGTFSPNATTPNATFTHTSGSGPITLRWTVSNAPCADATADVSVTITQPPTPATAGANQTICALSTTTGLGGNAPSVGTGMWSVVSGGAGTFNPNATTPNATFTHTSGTGPITLRWTISNAPCPSSFAELTITVSQAPTTASAGGPQTICALGTTASLGGNAPSSGTGIWTVQSGGAGTFNPSATTPNATFAHTSGTGPITLRWTISNAPCPSSFAELTITISQAPTTASAGGAQTICALGTTASLGGNTPSSGTGVWTIVTPGATGTFNPSASTPNAAFTHTGGTGTITLRWTISSPPCASSSADVVITITQPPTPATAGGAQTICAGSTTAGLGGNLPSSGTGMWSIVSGGTGTFSPNATTPNATFTPIGGAGAYVLRWTISNSACPDSLAEVTITVKQQPTATVGANQTICALGTTAGLGGNPLSGGASGMWTILSGGSGGFSPNAATPNATFTHKSGSGPVVLRWRVSNAPCADAMADVTITIRQPPTSATVGPNQTIAPGGTTASLGGNMPKIGTGQWTIVTAGASGTFNPNASTPNATFTHLSGSGQIVLRWTISNPPCPASSADVTIQIGVAPQITCPASPVMANAAAGTCAANVIFNVTASGIPAPTVSCSPPSGSSFPVGQTTVSCTASNNVSPNASCSFTVKVNDTQPPAFAQGCPASVNAVTQITCPMTTSQTVSYTTPAVTDNCAGATVSCVPPSGSVFTVGTTSVSCTATDASGNTAMCSFAVRVWGACLQDESNPGNVCLFDTQTGEYQFCCNGHVIATGTGRPTVRGCVVQIDHIKGNRKVSLRADLSVKRGTATVIIANQTTCVITDQNMANNNCQCPVSTAKP
jgi:uncharacterized repeat protein (TIGR01451 family)